jgi:hypothetical protein
MIPIISSKYELNHERRIKCMNLRKVICLDPRSPNAEKWPHSRLLSPQLFSKHGDCFRHFTKTTAVFRYLVAVSLPPLAFPCSFVSLSFASPSVLLLFYLFCRLLYTMPVNITLIRNQLATEHDNGCCTVRPMYSSYIFISVTFNSGRGSVIRVLFQSKY